MGIDICKFNTKKAKFASPISRIVQGLEVLQGVKFFCSLKLIRFRIGEANRTKTTMAVQTK